MMAVAKKVKVENLLPNPKRNFNIDPILQERVDPLIQSYKTSGDFSTLTARESTIEPGKFELACGHHRFAAMKQAGYKEIDVKVMDLNDAEMIQVMVKENATQRGTSPAAMQDSIAATLEFIAYELLRYSDFNDFNELSSVGTIVPTQNAWNSSRGLLKNGEGLGHKLLRKFTGNVIPEKVASQAIGSLKASGVIGELISKTTTLLSKEAEDARVEAEKAHKAAEEQARLEAEAAEKAEHDAIAKAKADEKAAIAKAKGDKEKAEAKAKREADERKATAKKKEADDKAKADKAEREKQERIQRDKDAANQMLLEVTEREAAEKLARKVHPDALKLFKKSNHQDIFRKLIEENTIFPLDQHVNVANGVLLLCEKRKRLNKKTDGLTVEGIQAAISKMVRDGKIFTKEIKKEEDKRREEAKKSEDNKNATEDIIFAIGNLENDLLNNTKNLGETIDKYVSLLKLNPKAEEYMNILVYKRSLERVITKLSEFDKILSLKLTSV